MSVNKRITEEKFIPWPPLLVEGNPDPGPHHELNMEQWLERRDHPLLNHVGILLIYFFVHILTNVFEHVRREDLKSCRGVCKKWNILSIPFTRSAFPVTIFGMQGNPNTREGALRVWGLFDLIEHLMPAQITLQRKITDFIDVIRGNQLGIPFGRYRLGSFNITDGVGQEFLRFCGETTREISFLEENIRIEDLSEILRSTPKLETLSIPNRLHPESGKLFSGYENSKPKLTFLRELSISHHNPEEMRKVCTTCLEELIIAAPNISNIGLGGSDATENPNIDFCSRFKLLELIERLGRESSIQTLYFPYVMSEHVELLRRMTTKPKGLKLKTLEFNTVRGVDPFEVVNIFKHTLEHLTLLLDKCTTFLEFPVIPHLKKLKVQMHLNSRGVNFQNIFPTLEKLHIRHDPLCSSTENTHDEYLSESVPCPTVKRLKLLSNYLKMNHVLSVFPNLTKLKLEVTMDEDILAKIWNQMTQLEVLHLIGMVRIRTEKSLDSLFTGIPNQTIQEVRDKVKGLNEMTDELRRSTISQLRNEHCQLPSISNLTNLRYLKLGLVGSTNNLGTHCLTDITGYLALYSMKHINRLFIRYQSPMFSWTCSEILKAELRLESIEKF